jgi:hypothetical protein
MRGARYLEHLTAGDLSMLGAVAGVDPNALITHPAEIEDLLADTELYRRLFVHPDAEPFVGASPFLVFASLVHRCAKELPDAAYIMERTGPRSRLPIFDTRVLADFIDAPAHRLFLAELLTSYTHITSGTIYRRDRRGWRAHRFSELDPVRLASLLSVVDERERPGVFRRLGDTALFLSGVFPDHSSRWLSGSLNEDRMRRFTQLAGHKAVTSESDLGLLEELGRHCYRIASATSAAPLSDSMRVVASVAENFDEARRVLNYLTDRYLFAMRSRWFPGMG